MSQVLAALQKSVQIRCCCIDRKPAIQTPANVRLTPAPVLILFSGGVDSTLIAILAHRALPIESPIDLACVCFDGGSSPDRLAAVDALQARLFPKPANMQGSTVITS